MNNAVKTTIASTTAAAILATGTYLLVDSNSSEDKKFSINWEQIIPNIDQYLPKIPSLNIVKIDLPKIDLPEIDTKLLDDDLQNLNIKTNINKEIESTKIISEIETTSNSNINDYTVNLEILLNDDSISSIDKDLSNSDLQLDKLTATYDFNAYNEFKTNYLALKNMIKDKRYLYYDNEIIHSNFLKKWISIYKNYSNKKFDTIKLTNKFRMISEIRMPKSYKEFEILKTNLNYYKSRGYDSVLIVFDGSETPNDLENLVKYVKYLNLRPFGAFGGRETLHTSIFLEPDMFSKQLKSIAKYCEGFIIGWRRTSAHLIEQDDEFMNFIIENVRSANSQIHIFGEIYYGNNAKNEGENNWGISKNIPNCSSAIMLVNFGFLSINTDYVVNSFAKKLTNVPLIGLVVGHRPYYLSTHKNNYSQEKNQLIKEKIESKFIKSGCFSTITLHDDGRDSSDSINNNLSSTLYTLLGK
jgi:hypothetical protein